MSQVEAAEPAGPATSTCAVRGLVRVVRRGRVFYRVRTICMCMCMCMVYVYMYAYMYVYMYICL